MIKTKYILLCLLCLFVLRASAQSLVAYHVVGKVTYMVNGEIKPLVMSTKVDGNTRVNVPYGGKVEFLDEKNQKRIIIKTQGQGAVSQLLSMRTGPAALRPIGPKRTAGLARPAKGSPIRGAGIAKQ